MDQIMLIKFKLQRCNCWKLEKPDLQDLSGNSPQICECYWSVYGKKLESFVSENVLIGLSFSKWKCLVWCPHSRSQKTHGILFWESEIETFVTKDLIQLKAQRSFSLSLWFQVCLVPVLRFPVPLGQFTSVTYARRTGGKAGNIFFSVNYQGILKTYVCGKPGQTCTAVAWIWRGNQW